ncbi:MAG: hypothetical protein HQP72_08465 [Methanoculleus sp.]|jgi:hypothetical protein|nr:hypothetical protein [Methanoculleus sp.]
MPRDLLLYLEDIRDAIAAIRSYVGDRSFEDFIFRGSRGRSGKTPVTRSGTGAPPLRHAFCVLTASYITI